tara:strand:+ start:3033 stop:4058 length:1026 start_codon:yes stop_codon:yes gene_type:complete
VKVFSIEVEEGEYFDNYNLRLAPGVRHSKVDRLLTDIGLAISAHSVPIGYPVMKTGSYVIEVQTKEIDSPSFLDIYSNFKKDQLAPIAIGRDNSGDGFYVDLNTVPNLLVGGTTGSGKSMLLHSFVLSLLATRAKIYLVDPKMVEFGLYEGLSGIQSISNSVEETEAVINEVRDIMEKRFDLLKRNNCRNISEYNNFSGKSPLKPVVIIVDEWADIVLQKRDIQKPLCFLAQKGRAAGISIILATQRPSSSVISGLVKANFPGRIAMKVASAIDSRVILDKKGAEDLTDIGTGLYLDGRLSEPVLFRAPLLSSLNEEIESLSLSKVNEAKKKKSLWGMFWS